MIGDKAQGLGGALGSSGKNYDLTKGLGVPGVAAMPGEVKQKSPQEMMEELEKLKKKLDGLKKDLVKKYKFTRAITIMPAAASGMIVEDEQIPKEIAESKPWYVMMIIPEDQYKNIPKIKAEVVKMAKDCGENVWMLIKTEVDLWYAGMDSKFDVLDSVGASFPLYDNGFLGSLRVANIHKTLVLRKFEKYVASYVVFGSLVRGTADKTSDVDTFVIIDDTDIKQMPRLQLLEKLRGIIYDYIREASALAGVKNILNVQVSLLTDFWQRVKDAEPVAFTMLRDGVPMYDRGTFIPWKLLLQMGKIKPSQEAIDQYMKNGEQTKEMVKRRLMDSLVDVYWGVVTPTQAMMMLSGEAPAVPKELISEVKKVLVQREKVMTAKDLKTLEKLVGLYKGYEHGTVKEISGKEIDELLVLWEAYQKELKKMRAVLEQRMQDKTADEVYDQVFGLLENVLGVKGQSSLVKAFGEQMVKVGKVQPRFGRILEELVKMKGKMKRGKVSARESDKVKKDASELLNALTEYAQRKELLEKRGVFAVRYDGGKKVAEVVAAGSDVFVVVEGAVKAVKNGKLVASSEEVVRKALEKKGGGEVKIGAEVFGLLEKELGSFEVSL